MLTEPEVYKKAFWRDLPKRSRGRKDHPAARVKAAFSDYIRKHPELSSSAKLVGGLITSWYSESRGYAWPSNSAMAEDLGLGVRTVRMATGELHERGLIHKVEGGGWDRRRVRHISNQYYPAFSMVLNQDNGAIIKNAPYLCQESPETRSNLRKYPAESAPRQNLPPLNRENRQNTAEVPGNICPPHSDNEVADAPSSLSSPNGSSAPVAPPEEEEDDDDEEEEEEKKYEPWRDGECVGGGHVRVNALAQHLEIPPDDILTIIKSEIPDDFVFPAISETIRKHLSGQNPLAFIHRHCPSTGEGWLRVHIVGDGTDGVYIVDDGIYIPRHDLTADDWLQIGCWEPAQGG